MPNWNCSKCKDKQASITAEIAVFVLSLSYFSYLLYLFSGIEDTLNPNPIQHNHHYPRPWSAHPWHDSGLLWGKLYSVFGLCKYVLLNTNYQSTLHLNPPPPPTWWSWSWLLTNNSGIGGGSVGWRCHQLFNNPNPFISCLTIIIIKFKIYLKAYAWLPLPLQISQWKCQYQNQHFPTILVSTTVPYMVTVVTWILRVNMKRTYKYQYSPAQ